MADRNIVKAEKADRRRRRVRAKVKGTAAIPRLTVSKSLNNTFVQLIDDIKQVTLLSTATNAKAVSEKLGKKNKKTDAARVVGEVIASLAKEKGIEQVVFDRNQYRYHGRVKAVAEGARKGGLKF
jgi:large subunit ribosomal protein L18